MKDPAKVAELFQTKVVHKRTHVLSVPQNFRYKAYPDPDYLGTSMALIGILNPGQSIDDFKKEWIERQSK